MKRKTNQSMLILIFPIFLNSTAFAQQDNKRILEEVIVTAQKRSQSLQDVPMSVSALSGDMASEAAIVDAQSLVQYTPNVKFTASNPQNSSTTIRGFGSPPLARNIEPSVGLVIDGISYGRSTFTNDGVFDLERLEVLRGPQGTLFGKNTIAGVLNFTTKSPSFEPEGYVQVAEERLDGKRYEAAASFPIIDEVLAARISWRKREKYLGLYNTARNNEKEEFKDESVRVRLDYLPNENIDIKLIAFSSEYEGVGNGFQHSYLTDTARATFAQKDPKIEDDEFNDTRSANSPTYSNRASDSIALKTNIDIGDFLQFRNSSIDALISWARVDTPFLLDTDFSPVNSGYFETDGPERYKQKHFELRYSADSLPLFGWGHSIDWMFGLFAGQAESHVSQNTFIVYDGLIALAPVIAEGRGVPLPAFLGALFSQLADIGVISAVAEDIIIETSVHTKSETYALFGQADWHLSDSVTTSLGLRIGTETIDGEQSNYSDSPIPEVTNGSENYYEKGRIKEDEFSPKIAISWSPVDELTLFGNVSKGFKSGGFSGPIINTRYLRYKPEEALSAELGIKSRLLQQTLEVNATLYSIQFDNLQLNIFDGTVIYTTNVEEAESWGVEVDFNWLPPMPWLTVQGSLGFNEAKYGDFPCGPTTWDDRNAAPECGQDAPPSQDLSGKELPFNPKITGSLTPTIRFPIARNWNIGGMFAFDILYQGEHYLDYDLDEKTLQEATTKINARLAIGPENKRWAVIFNAKNLTEEQERMIVLDTTLQGGNYVAITHPDETQYSIDFRYNFGITD
ncbi:TonB-dependent receptor [Zhongshania sp. BJYM1]|uniref:TonB-dependent receptor n=1 Tax=Zhongshania aquatica TaxID=2965069 RepID=UPI0022B2C7E3|nr:TonB-dependent receptor [Marortus sp. BJYM1]